MVKKNKQVFYSLWHFLKNLLPSLFWVAFWIDGLLFPCVHCGACLTDVLYRPLLCKLSSLDICINRSVKLSCKKGRKIYLIFFQCENWEVEVVFQRKYHEDAKPCQLVFSFLYEGLLYYKKIIVWIYLRALKYPCLLASFLPPFLPLFPSKANSSIETLWHITVKLFSMIEVSVAHNGSHEPCVAMSHSKCNQTTEWKFI